jgi:excisionase family DNA binding protein
MNIAFENSDLDAFAQKVFELLKPILTGNNRNEDKDTIFTPETLSKYLQVDTSWVYKQVSLKTLPYFKSGKYTRFKKKDIEKWIENQTVRPIPSIKTLKKAG